MQAIRFVFSYAAVSKIKGEGITHSPFILYTYVQELKMLALANLFQFELKTYFIIICLPALHITS